MDSDLSRELQHARIASAAAERRRERSLSDQAAESATFIGICLDLAEQAEEILLRTGAAVYQGKFSAVGSDHVQLTVPNGTVVVPNRVVRTISPINHRSKTTGDRPASSNRCLMDVLTDLAESRSEIVLRLDETGDDLRGVIEAVGRDVVTMRSTGPDQRRTYLPAVSLGAFSVMASG